MPEQADFTIGEEINGLIEIKNIIDKIIEETKKMGSEDQLFEWPSNRAKDLHNHFDYDIQEYLDILRTQ